MAYTTGSFVESCVALIRGAPAPVQRMSEDGIRLSRGSAGVRDSEVAPSFLSVDWLLARSAAAASSAIKARGPRRLKRASVL
jgi:hypothetical protein